MPELVELKCKHCGSTNLEYEHGVWVCQNCGSKYILPSSTTSKADEYREKMIDAMKAEDEDYMHNEDDYMEAKERRLKEQKKYTDKLLKVAPEDPWGWASICLLCISQHPYYEDTCMECTEAVENTAKYMEKCSEEEQIDIARFIAIDLQIEFEALAECLSEQSEVERLYAAVMKIGSKAYGSAWKLR